jgi:serine/threonine protein kinase
VLPATFATDPDRFARFEREARLLASLNHPHIAQIYGVEEAGGGAALVLELVDGETLAQRIAPGAKNRPLPIDEALGIARQLADALDAAHERGIVHGDLKPANIVVTPDGAVKVLDFGLATERSASVAGSRAPDGLTHSPTMLGPTADRSGKPIDSVGPDHTPVGNPALSPDGLRIAFSRVVEGNWDIWLMDLHGAMSRFTSDPALDFNPLWSSDGRRIFFQSTRGGAPDIYSRSVNAGTPEEVLLKSSLPKSPSDVSADGRVLLYNVSTGTSTQIWSLTLDGGSAPRPFVQTTFDERDGQFSPDGKWVAYQSNESGHYEIYLQPFPGRGERIPVSSGGGQQVRWGRRGPKLFYVAADRRLAAVPRDVRGERHDPARTTDAAVSYRLRCHDAPATAVRRLRRWSAVSAEQSERRDRSVFDDADSQLERETVNSAIGALKAYGAGCFTVMLNIGWPGV